MNRRTIEQAVAITALRACLLICGLILVGILGMIITQGIGVFIKYPVSELTLSGDEMTLGRATVKNALSVDGMNYDLVIEDATVNGGTVTRGIILDIGYNRAVGGTTKWLELNRAELQGVTVTVANPRSGRFPADLNYTADAPGAGSPRVSSAILQNLVIENGSLSRATIPVLSIDNGRMQGVPCPPDRITGAAFSLNFLTARPEAGITQGGIMPAILGTFYLVIGTMLIALPLGILAGIYLAEYAGEGWFTNTIRTAVSTLAGVPSIVHGLFGLSIFVILLKFGVSVLAGSCTMAILILPIIINTTEEAIRVVPQDFREASWGLGATKYQTILRVILPAALPSILTGCILGIGRAAGETAPILFTCAAYFLPQLPNSPFSEIMALPYHIYALMTEATSPAEQVPIAWGTALVLLLLVFGTNLAAIIWRARLRRNRTW